VPEGRSLKEAGAGEGRPPHAEAPLPLERSILWTPGGTDAGTPDPTRDVRTYPLFIEHDVLAGVNRHLARDEHDARFGFLLGRLFYCPDLAVNYAVVDTAVAASDVLAEEASGSDLIQAWREARSVFAGHSGLLLGWYHSHEPRTGLRLTDADRDTNARYFDAPWQCAVVVVPDREPLIGAVFRHRGAGTAGGGERPAPFHELFTAPHGGKVGDAESAVRWSNYRAHQPVAAEEYANADPAAPDAATAGIEGGEPEAEAPTPAAPTPPREEVGRPGPRGVRPEDHPGRNPPLVIPGEGDETGLFSPRARPPGGRRAGAWLTRARAAWPVRPWIVVGVAVLAAAVFFLLPALRDDTPEPVRPTSSTPRAREATSSEMRSFLELVDAVEIAGDRYAERAADFDAGRIGCDLLTTGYVAADEAYVRVAAAYRQFGADPNPRATSAYERAGSELADVNRHFDSTDCPRP
jgi:proteasome lid subunit RPN8/RPN11